MKKRALSLLLALLLALSLNPAVLAYDGQTSEIVRTFAPAEKTPVLTEVSPAVTGWAEPIPYAEQVSVPETRSLYGASIDEEEVYRILNGLRSVYPEGMIWTNESQQYRLSVPIYDEENGTSAFWMGYGCVAFCYRLSDAAFGNLSARNVYNFTYDDIHIGDILRVYRDTHSVTVLEKYSNYVVLAEGNYNSSVHWGRTMTRAEVMQANYITTRYPSNALSEPTGKPSNVKISTDKSIYSLDEKGTISYSADNADSYNFSLWLGAYGTGTLVSSKTGINGGKITWTLTRAGTYTLYLEAVNSKGIASATCQFTVTDGTPFADVPAAAYYADAVKWAYSNGIAAGTSTTTFSPNDTVTRGQAVAFLWRAMGKHSPSASQSHFTDVSTSDYYFQAVQWAAENGIAYGVSATEFDPNGAVKRGEMITFLWRAMGRPGETGQGKWYEDAERWARSDSLLTGTAAAYATEAACPRSDVVYYLWKALG